MNADGRSTLLIDSAKPEHNQAKLSVTAENESGKATSSGQLVVEPKGQPPEITQSPNSRTVSEHEVVQFSATVVSKLRPLTIEWSVNGQVIQPTNSEFGLTQSGDQFTLRVNDSAVSQTGQIKVKATNPAGSTEANADFQVNKKIKPVPKFQTQLPSDLKAKEGEPLQVSVKAPHADNIEWTLNGKPLQVCFFVVYIHCIKRESKKEKRHMTQFSFFLYNNEQFISLYEIKKKVVQNETSFFYLLFYCVNKQNKYAIIFRTVLTECISQLHRMVQAHFVLTP